MKQLRLELDDPAWNDHSHSLLASSRSNDTIAETMLPHLAQTLVNIVQAAAQAYQNQTGQPIDPSLIKPEAPL